MTETTRRRTCAGASWRSGAAFGAGVRTFCGRRSYLKRAIASASRRAADEEPEHPVPQHLAVKTSASVVFLSTMVQYLVWWSERRQPERIQ